MSWVEDLMDTVQVEMRIVDWYFALKLSKDPFQVPTVEEHWPVYRYPYQLCKLPHKLTVT